MDLVSPGLCPYEEDGYVLSYNGEIYNFVELRKELAERGWRFRTTGDTEVLLKAWRAWGPRMFERLNGMFAFAIYDKAAGQLVLARDIVGEKPLYYYHKGDTFIFASEAKAIAKIVPVRERQDEFFEAFQHHHLETPWEDVRALAPAHYMVYDVRARRFDIKEYWTLPRRYIDRNTAAEELEALLGEAVKIRLRADVPLALYFSGGIDSSLIATYHPFDYQHYFDREDPAHQEAFFREIPRVLYHLDFPVGSFGFYGMWRLASEASKQVKVIISGEGADEIFGGYVRYLPVAREYELRKHYPSYQYLFDKHSHEAYLDRFARITARNGNIEFVRETLRPYFDMFPDPVNAMGFADFKLILPSLMQMGDRMAGAFGIENRCVFMDRRIIEFGFNLPADLKIRDLEQKIMLRRVAKKRGLTEALKMEKRGMSVPYNRWMGIEGWDREHYFEFLKKTWRDVYAQQAPQVQSLQLPITNY